LIEERGVEGGGARVGGGGKRIKQQRTRESNSKIARMTFTTNQATKENRGFGAFLGEGGKTYLKGETPLRNTEARNERGSPRATLERKGSKKNKTATKKQ